MRPLAYWKKLGRIGGLAVVAGLVVFVAGGVSAYAWYFSDRIVPHTRIGSLAVGGLTRTEAATHLQEAVDHLQVTGIQLDIEGEPEVIPLDDVGFDLNLGQAVEDAFARGHGGALVANVAERIGALWNSRSLEAPVHVDAQSLDAQLTQISAASDTARQDIRLAVSGTQVRLATDTKPGRIIDRTQAADAVMRSLASLDAAPVALILRDDPPVADPALADAAVSKAQRMLSRALSLSYEDLSFFISRDRIGGWLVSEYEGTQLVPAMDRQAIAQYVTGVAKSLNVDPEPPRISTEGGRVTGFVPPKVGRAVQESQLVDMIIGAITDRAGKDRSGDTIIVPTKTAKMSLMGLDSSSGITELIGKATTPFTGSPKNRISNIKNGVKFLSGTMVQPGQEFSTLGTLGTIDNTTGYLPELVIKGDRTTPDFGGGLCQVSTTLFRAVMDTGLPVTARRNHSYRVSYYEKDGNGKVIGPGLDATIYEPDLDFKFRNDTASPVLIIGYVIGDKVTFELYGTKDGRTSNIDGPHLLTETAPGEPVYIDSDTLPLGMKKQVETPHPGGSAVATYTITYADGHVVPQEFRSYYRRWPTKFLVGTNTACTTAAQCAALTATPTPSIVPKP